MKPWGKAEVDAIVTDYFSMLCRELKGEPYRKTAHRQRLVESLPDRNTGSVQKKYQTISAALSTLGLPSIRGYKPLDKYQTLLVERIDAHLESHPEILDLLMAHARRSLSLPMQRGLFYGAAAVDAPQPRRPGSGKKERLIRKVLKKYTYAAAEAGNPDLRDAGEAFVVDFERGRLREKGDFQAAEAVMHIPKTQAAAAFYDIRSFENDETPLFIKVKTTSWGAHFPFSLSAAELAFSAAHPGAFRLYRLFDFPGNPRLFILKGRLYDGVRLTPVSYLARFG